MLSREEALRRLNRVVEGQSTLVLSTAGDEGPSGAPLFYVPLPDLRLAWLSSPRSRHAIHGEADPRAAVSIFAPTFRWEEILGAQLQGRVEVVREEEERAGILAAYERRFGLGASFDGIIAASVLYRFEPTRARLLDNRLGFPGRVEISFEG